MLNLVEFYKSQNKYLISLNSFRNEIVWYLSPYLICANKYQPILTSTDTRLLFPKLDKCAFILHIYLHNTCRFTDYLTSTTYICTSFAFPPWIFSYLGMTSLTASTTLLTTRMKLPDAGTALKHTLIWMKYNSIWKLRQC